MNRHLLKTCTAALALVGLTTPALADHIWINEFHYDNQVPSADANEFVEVVLRTPNTSGFSASDYAIEFYNGSNGDFYGITDTLDAYDNISTTTIGGVSFTFYGESYAGIQNGAPDGLALVNVTNNTVAQFLSYEGAFTADADNGGIAGAAGVTSTDIGVAETTGVTEVQSLGLVGAGDAYEDFTWAGPLLATSGSANVGQTLVPEPASLALVALGGLTLVGRRRQSA